MIELPVPRTWLQTVAATRHVSRRQSWAGLGVSAPGPSVTVTRGHDHLSLPSLRLRHLHHRQHDTVTTCGYEDKYTFMATFRCRMEDNVLDVIRY